jgi:hypothetical protein
VHFENEILVPTLRSQQNEASAAEISIKHVFMIELQQKFIGTKTRSL